METESLHILKFQLSASAEHFTAKSRRALFRSKAGYLRPKFIGSREAADAIKRMRDLMR